MRSRTSVGAVLAAGLLAGAVLALGSGAGADAAAGITGVGWWTRQPAAPARNGGFQVASAPDGAFSEAGLRVRIDSPSLTKAVLTLTESGGLRQDAATIQVCATSGTWATADPGTWDQAPKADCQARAVKLDRNTTQSSWSGDVLPLLSAAGSSASLMVLPAPPAAPVDLGFQVDFTAAALTAEGEPPVAVTPDTSGSSPSLGTSESAAGLSPSLTAPVTPAPTPAAPVPAEASSAAPAPSPPAPSAPAEPAAFIPRHGGAKPGRSHVRWGRLLLFLPLSGMVVAAGAVGHRAYREPDLLFAGLRGSWRAPWSRPTSRSP
ncbi:MAG TPA: hypothetical protein VKI20_05940 [Acidimicrobiales bacterium]|nr:hypothetical protein [Acidimicrobiales bacterium]